MQPLQVFGRNGKSLSEIWNGLPRAYKGVTVEGIPNFGMLYGPNSNLSHNSLILVIEAQARYINKLANAVLDSKARGKSLLLTPKPEVVQSYNSNIQTVLNKTSFADPNCNSWWKNSEGVITNNWPGTAVEYQNLLADVFWDDYDAEEGNGREGSVQVEKVQQETHLGNSWFTSTGMMNWLCSGWFSTLRNSRKAGSA